MDQSELTWAREQRDQAVTPGLSLGPMMKLSPSQSANHSSVLLSIDQSQLSVISIDQPQLTAVVPHAVVLHPEVVRQLVRDDEGGRAQGPRLGQGAARYLNKGHS